MKRILSLALAGAMMLSLGACSSQPPAEEVEETVDLVSELGLTAESKEATDFTAEVNSAVYSQRNFADTSEYENATRGLIAAPEALELKDAEGDVIWSQAAYGFLEDYEEPPATVNPSLWENTRNNHAYGLFEVVEGIYQVRGYDMANLTLIAGDTGWILFDPMMSVECTQAAMELVAQHLGERPVKAVIISHPHVDHFGGVGGVVTEETVADSSLSLADQLASGKIPVIVPEGFLEYAVSENIYAGAAMSRRANYQFGSLLEPGPAGTLGIGIGMGQSKGLVSFLAPTYEVKQTGETMTIDGVELEFQMTPGTEAPAEMNTWLPQHKALWMAENCTGTLHNLYTMRGAQVRDGNQWALYLYESLRRYGDQAEVVFQSHNWPHWGQDVIQAYLLDTAAVYKYINDQTLTLLNQGYTSNEIAAMMELPDHLAQNWYTRQYYGTLVQNVKAVYQKYMGWYDGNPVHLNALAPTESAKKWVEYLKDTDEVLRMAKADYDAGQYQWVAEVTNVLVYADPANEAARFLCADALEQLGYQSESGTWRNAYLTAAKELREGNEGGQVVASKNDGNVVKNMTPEMIFDYMGVMLDKKAMEGQDMTIHVNLSDQDRQFVLQLRSGVLLYWEGAPSGEADLTITCPEKGLLLILNRNAEAVAQVVQVEGDSTKLDLFMENLNQVNVSKGQAFNIVEP